MRTIKKIHSAGYRPIADLVTYTPLPSPTIDTLDPFLFLNHHGLQTYPPNNNGLPFGPHPHRGMETVTFIIEGDIMHKDSSGHESIIQAGGVQWMTAGSGLIHAEVSSPNFRKNGGRLEILQLWINLPASLKMTSPSYHGLQLNEIPVVTVDNGNIAIRVISGEIAGKKGAISSLTNVTLSYMTWSSEGTFSVNVPSNQTIFFYVVRGELLVNNAPVQMRHLVEFTHDDELITIAAKADTIILFGYAKPLNEPVVAQGPFVMNSEEEIAQAYEDYQQGKFGSWE
jgi:redox-sensitive bicupin YhaK (pirin superfamily)